MDQDYNFPFEGSETLRLERTAGSGPYQHDRNQSLPNAALQRDHSITAGVRPARAATFSRGAALTHGRRQSHRQYASISQQQLTTTASGPNQQAKGTVLHATDSNSGLGYGTAITSVEASHNNQGNSAPSNDTDANGSVNMDAFEPAQRSASGPPATYNYNNNKSSDPKTPSEYALHILFTQFVRYAERKLNLCLSYSLESEPRIAEILGAGNDPAFDKIITSLGYIARRKPKPVIDSVMFWRKSKSEAAAAANASASSHSPVAPHSRSESRNDIDSIKAENPREVAIQADRKSLISIYILCRVLMEVIRQTPPDVLGDDLSEKLEEIVFKQLKTADPELISGSIIRRANWNLFAELLGEMSEARFSTVGDRFIADLEKVPDSVSKEKEVSTQLVIHGMRYLKVRLYPMDKLEDGCDFLSSLSKFFARCQSQRIKLAYAEIVSQILSPIAGYATAELNHPTWTKSIDVLWNKAMEMLSKPKYWQAAFPLATTVLCDSPQELFSKSWFSLIENNVSKLKDRPNRPIFYSCAARLLWVYLCRCTESLNNTTKKLEIMSKALFSITSKKIWMIPDPLIVSPCIYLIRVTAHGYLQFPLENILFQLLHNSTSSEILNLDNVIPERAIISIRAFVAILKDIDSGERPPFPTEEVLGSFMNDWLLQSPTQLPKTTGAVKEFYDKYCSAMNKLLVLCDLQFGAQATASEEKTNQLRTPMSVSFHFGNDNTSQNQRQSYVELFCVVLENLPWLSEGYVGKTVEILCKNVVHGSRIISQTAGKALKTLARIKDTRIIVDNFRKQLFAYDEQLFSSYDVATTSSSDYERLLRIYVELLEIWIERIKSATNGQGEGNKPEGGVDDSMLNNWWPSVEEVEGNGLYFLCSQDRAIRHLAIKILRLTTEFDKAIRENAQKAEKSHARKPSKSTMLTPSRLISYVEKADISVLLDSSQPAITLSMPERTRLNKLHGKRKETLVRIAESDYGVDTALWLKAFPSFMKECFENFPIPIAIARNVVCVRLVQMHDVVLEFTRVENPIAAGRSSHAFSVKHPMRTHPEVVVEQWRIYLVVACSTLTLTDEQKLHVPESQYQHGRKKSIQKITIHHQRITSVRSVFRMVMPLLGVDQPIIRDAIVTGISCINVNIYRAMIECLKPAIQSWKDTLKQPIRAQYNFSPRRDPSTGYRHDRIITEITHVLRVTAHYLGVPMIYDDDWIITELVNFLTDLRSFLTLSEVQTDWDYQKLRRFFCGVVERLYLGIGKSSVTSKLLSFEARAKFFNLIEEWSPLGQSNILAKDRESIMKQAALATCKDGHDRNLVLASMELEKRKSEKAIISAMAALCCGTIPDPDPNSSRAVLSFNVGHLLKWIYSVFSDSRDEMQENGKRALKYILSANIENGPIFQETVANCYRIHVEPKANRSYFATIGDVLLSNSDYPCDVYKPLTLGLYKTGDSDPDIRALAVKLLKATEIRFYGSSCLREYESSITSLTPTVFKRAMFNLSSRFAQDHPQEAFMVFSELTMFFQQVDDVTRRDILVVLLPWVQTVELKVEVNDTLSPSAAMVICNLLEITIVFSHLIQTEVEALWVALGNGRDAGNIKVVMNFVFHYCLERRDPAFLEYARKIMVYLGATAVGVSLVEALLSNLKPKSMIPQHPEPFDFQAARAKFPYVADIVSLLPARPSKDTGFSNGQLSMILLVDLMLPIPLDTIRNDLPLVLHVAFVLFDHYLPIVSGQAREMLVLLVHQLASESISSELFCDSIRRKDPATQWGYDDLNSDKDGARTPKAMAQLISDIIGILEKVMPNLREQWARIALSWATTCPVRHLACRSFQVFRSLLSFLDKTMLADMLARLSNTISDSTPDIQGFAMQILMTLNAIAAELDAQELINYPQVFWATVACLNTVNEQEFIEVLSVLEKFLSKIDLDSPDTVSCLISTFPPKWEGTFQGLQQAVLPGLRSANSWEQSLRVLDKLDGLKASKLVAGSNRLVLALASNLPRYLHALEIGKVSSEIEESTMNLKEMCDEEDRPGLSRILTSLAKGRFRSKKDFLKQTVQAIQTNFFPQHEATVLSFFLSISSNKVNWIKLETLEVLKLIFPMVDMQNEEFIGVGADIISPLLRLLQTDYAQQALSVLDEAASISSSKMDKHVLRMSLGNRTMRKEYERTATLFGIPDESGWAVPMPAITMNVTRNNVHAVFYTCAPVNNDETDQSEHGEGAVSANDEFQFLKEEYGGYSGTGILDRSESLSVADDGSLSNMWTALDNLDSFFTKDMKRYPGTGDQSGHHSHNISVTDTDISADNTIDPVESVPQLYDKKVSLILNRSLARTPSTTSFKTSLADSFGNGISMTDGLGNFGLSVPSHYPRTAFYNNKANKDSGSNLTTKYGRVELELNELSDGGFDDEYDEDDDSSLRTRIHTNSQTVSPSTTGMYSPSPVIDSSPPLPLSTSTSKSLTSSRKQNPNDSSFRLEGLLRGATNIAKKKSSKLQQNGESSKEEKSNKKSSTTSSNLSKFKSAGQQVAAAAAAAASSSSPVNVSSSARSSSGNSSVGTITRSIPNGSSSSTNLGAGTAAIHTQQSNSSTGNLSFQFPPPGSRS